MSFDECLSVPENPKQTACDFQFKNRILQLTYFCGSALLCQQGGNFDVIQRSKYNVEAYFSVVGMSHDLKRSFELLEVLLPAFFKGNRIKVTNDVPYARHYKPWLAYFLPHFQRPFLCF